MKTMKLYQLPLFLITLLFLLCGLSPRASFAQASNNSQTLLSQATNALEQATNGGKEKIDEKKESSISFLGMELYDEDATKLLFRFLLNIFFVFILIRLIYYPLAQRKDFLFTYIAISVTVFMLCFLLENVKLDLAFALGLFAIFGIIRYRTDPIPIKEMTYLFIIIGMSVLNALVNKKISYTELLIANGTIILITYGLERVWLLRHESYKVVLYDNIELIQAGKRENLISDLQQRTGLKINRVEIGRIDFLRDTALLRIYFFEDDQLSHYEEGRD